MEPPKNTFNMFGYRSSSSPVYEDELHFGYFPLWDEKLLKLGTNRVQVASKTRSKRGHNASETRMKIDWKVFKT